MSAWFDKQNLPGLAHRMRLQSGEERDHALKLFDHMLDRGWEVRLQALDEPRADYASPLDAVNAALEHEHHITRLIDNLYEAAVEAHDHPAQVFLQWFVQEQVEEEKTALRLVEDVRRAGDDAAVLLVLDGRLREN